ncbi:MAG: hypothetical protein IH845_02400 [Nanoarchaeota archaeon]|nr:hypothetical protein [Nanoarchaeota archaeon]
MIKSCINCNIEKEHHAKGLCYVCYKKLKWEPKISVCKRCKRKIQIHAKGLCPGCYNYTFHLEKNKEYAHRKSSGVDLKTYRKATKECTVCGFDKIVDLYHLDTNKKNNAEENLIGLCPNHHRMINNYNFRLEIYSKLQKKGFKLPIDKKLEFYKKD